MKVKSRYSLDYIASDGKIFDNENECKFHENILDIIKRCVEDQNYKEAFSMAKIHKLTTTIKIHNKGEDRYGLFNYDNGKFKNFLCFKMDNTLECSMLHDKETEHPSSGFIYNDDGSLLSHKKFSVDEFDVSSVMNFLKDITEEENKNDR